MASVFQAASYAMHQRFAFFTLLLKARRVPNRQWMGLEWKSFILVNLR
jgi:hypothetical protein